MVNRMYRICEKNELYHYGVKGMKWGVRHDKNTTGSGPHRLTEKQKKAIKVGAIVVGTAATAYVLHRYGNKNFDRVIKSGTKIQHMSKVADKTLDSPFYASYLPKDNRVYEKGGFLGANWNTKYTLKSSSDIRVAGRKKAEKIYKSWLATNDDARNRFGKQSYFSFNRNLNSPDFRDKKMFNSFYRELQNNGYQAIRDLNDQFQTGTSSPIIIFGRLGDISISDIKKIR